MSHPSLPKIKANLERRLKKLGITRDDLNELIDLQEQETWAEEWVKDDWPHA